MTRLGDENAAVVHPRGKERTTEKGLSSRIRDRVTILLDGNEFDGLLEEELERYFVSAQHDEKTISWWRNESIASRDKTTMAQVEAAVNKAGLL